MQVTLEIKSGPFAGKDLSLEGRQAITVGRAQRADFAIPEDKFLSGVHFTLECDGTACRVVDHKSANGTYLNGKRVTDEVARDGDEILAGKTNFTVRITGVSLPPDSKPSEEESVAGMAPGVAFSEPKGAAALIGNWSFGVVPEDWDVVEGFGARRAGKGAYPSEVMVSEDPVSAGTTLQQYVNSQLAMLRQLVSEPQIRLIGPATIMGADEATAVLVRYETDDGRRFVQRQVYARSGELFGVVTATTLEGELPLVQSVFDRIMGNLTFKKAGEDTRTDGNSV